MKERIKRRRVMGAVSVVLAAVTLGGCVVLPPYWDDHYHSRYYRYDHDRDDGWHRDHRGGWSDWHR